MLGINITCMKNSIRNSVSNSYKPLTVLMPTYNGATHLRMAIKSILKQSFNDFELLIIDDGSTDNTPDILTGFTDKRIKYVHKEHSGLASTLNYGLQIAAYDWVARMDADDICDFERLEKQVKNFSFQPTSIACTWCAYFDRSGIKFTVETPLNKIELKEKLLLHSYICHPSIIYNRNFILEKGGYDEKLLVFEDYDLWLRIFNNVRFEVLPEYMVFMRLNKNSLSHKGLIDEKHIVRGIQNKYYAIGKDICGVNKILENELHGWREYFYGSPKKARKYWSRELKTIFKFRIIIAYIFTFLSEKSIEILNRFQLRYRIKFLFSPYLLEVKRKYKYILKIIEEYSQ